MAELRSRPNYSVTSLTSKLYTWRLGARNPLQQNLQRTQRRTVVAVVFLLAVVVADAVDAVDAAVGAVDAVTCEQLTPEWMFQLTPECKGDA